MIFYEGDRTMATKFFSIALFFSILISSHSTMATEEKEGVGEVKISGFRAGLVEFDSNQNPRIYKEGDTFPFEVNGMCVAVGKTYPCQWKGFEFDYESPYEKTTFNCVSFSDRAQDFVYPDRLVAKKSNASTWGFSVEGRSGHYIRPQYTIRLTGKPMNTISICYHKGVEVFRWKTLLIPPSTH